MTSRTSSSGAIREEVTALLDRRDGLMLGICNGFQALIKLGLVPYGKILDADASIRSLRGVRILNRYDVEHIDPALFEQCIGTVFSEPQVDTVSRELNAEGTVFAVEYLPGQFDQRADSAAQCIQIISQGERPLVRTAKVYVLTGNLRKTDIETIERHVINPVEARKASLELPDTLEMTTNIPTTVAVLDDFLDLDRDGLQAMIDSLGLAMDLDDIAFCQNYFRTQGRCPTITEVRMLDTPSSSMPPCDPSAAI